MKDESTRDLYSLAYDAKCMAKIAIKTYNEDAEPETEEWGDPTTCEVLALCAGLLRRTYEVIASVIDAEEEAEAQSSAEKI